MTQATPPILLEPSEATLRYLEKMKDPEFVRLMWKANLTEPKK